MTKQVRVERTTVLYVKIQRAPELKKNWVQSKVQTTFISFSKWPIKQAWDGDTLFGKQNKQQTYISVDNYCNNQGRNSTASRWTENEQYSFSKNED